MLLKLLAYASFYITYLLSSTLHKHTVLNTASLCLSPAIVSPLKEVYNYIQLENIRQVFAESNICATQEEERPSVTSSKTKVGYILTASLSRVFNETKQCFHYEERCMYS
jgi:hypothetical protein